MSEETLGDTASGGRIVIIGGGIIGLSIAFNLASQGYTSVRIIDRGLIGEGSTAKATGGIRQQFSSAINATLVHRSVDLFRRFEQDTQSACPFREHGYLFLLSQPSDLEGFRTAIEMQNGLGIPSRLISPEDIRSLFPFVRVDDLLGGAYCPSDGSATPNDAVIGYAKAGRRLGVEIIQNLPVTGILRRQNGHISGVQTPEGKVDAEKVIIAVGAYARRVGEMAGVDLPVSPRRRQAFAISPMSWISGDLPLTVDISTGAYLHPETTGAGIIGGNDRDVAEGYDTRVDWSLMEPLAQALSHRFPAMQDAAVMRGWAGLREMTPDDHALVGPIREVPGLWSAVGFSGHGFMQAPAIGEAIAQRLLHGSSTIDIDVLRPSRFRDGVTVQESVLF